MKRATLVMNLLLLLWTADLLGNAYINGAVIDAETKAVLPFANIRIVGTNNGIVSNAEGNYALSLFNIEMDDTVAFSYVGYNTFFIKVAKLKEAPLVLLQPSAMRLNEVQITPDELDAENIVAMAVAKFEDNHPSLNEKQRVFFHRHGITPFGEENKFKVKRSDFVGMDNQAIDDLFDQLPNEFFDYQDLLMDKYVSTEEVKLLPVEGVVLEKNSQKALIRDFEKKLGPLFNDMSSTMKDGNTYYKFRTGIFSKKIGNKKSDTAPPRKPDSLNTYVKTSLLKSEMSYLLNRYSRPGTRTWEFMEKTSRYNYTLEDIATIDEERVYQISFVPRGGGLFKGQVFVSTETYGILKLDFAYAPGKSNERFQMLGFGHVMKYKEGHVIYERKQEGYFLKYFYARQNEYASIDRKFSVSKKEKKFLFDKKLSQIKFSTDMSFDTETFWEYLVLDREQLGAQQFTEIKEPNDVQFKRKATYSPDQWGQKTAIAPVSELKKYEKP